MTGQVIATGRYIHLLLPSKNVRKKPRKSQHHFIRKPTSRQRLTTVVASDWIDESKIGLIFEQNCLKNGLTFDHKWFKIELIFDHIPLGERHETPY
jgi:hypothetical protein